MKLPSIQQLYSGFINVTNRFPLQLICSITATLCWCLYIFLSDGGRGINEDLMDNLIKGILISNLSLALLLALDLYAEVNKFTRGKKWGLRLAGLAIGILLFFILSPADHISDVYRIALLAFAFHLLIAFAPFAGKNNIGGFWQFNKILFLRFLTSALYSAVLYAGLAIALTAIRGLFNVDIEWRTYMVLFAVITAGFNTIFFLAGVPADLHLLSEDHSYPKGLKIFTQFVLIPLMTIYLAILLVYEVKIIVFWELPKGLVSSLILGYAVFGILSLLLVHPIKETEGNNWIKLFSRFFYFMMTPLIILLILAIWKRVSHYGITESRYILIILALWLAGIMVYFLMSKKDNIKVIPISLCILALLAVYGPQSAFSVSKYSQLYRLKKIISSKNASDQKEGPFIIRYLITAHGLETLQPFTTRNLREIDNKIDQKSVDSYVQKQMKIDTALSILKVKEEKGSGSITMTFINEGNEVLKVSGYDYLIELNTYPQPKELKIGGSIIKTDSNRNGSNLNIIVDGQSVLDIDLYSVFHKAAMIYKKGGLKPAKSKQGYYYPAEMMRFSKVQGQYEYTVVITSIENNYPGNSEDGNWTNSTSYLLIKKVK
ncbi:DUF4153 domain-containing protein [Pedobacter metabolipauper]|uniref:Uncharacterized protein DUF4153 n=1 Tax=Pedobacter metabolipauper TaxID=425513 RepID=A0A4R6SZ45_9SPHI|nr:DUF4153 domain-containing protein [Pedobacter metabolipauper]TDQ11726.1 uncharacterized protein DUF4153 [Pedobacter metabolipauper]